MGDSDMWFEETGEELPDDGCDDEFTETAPCPQCGVQVYEDAVQCPACGEYITHQANVWSGRPAWWIALALLGILATIWALAGLSR